MNILKVLNTQNELAKKYKYSKLPEYKSADVRALYESELPQRFVGNPNCHNTALFSTHETKFATGYDRIVIGDYGAFIEIPKSKMIRAVIKCQEGQEYRYKDLAYRDTVKYYWYTTKDASGLKIYFQQKTVSYADYKPDYFYVCPYEALA